MVHHYPSDMAQNFWGAIFAFSTNFVITVVVSLFTKPRPGVGTGGAGAFADAQTVDGAHRWWKRPEALGVAVLLGAVALNIFFA